MPERADVILAGEPMPIVVEGLRALFNVHVLTQAPDPDALIAELAPRARAMALGSTTRVTSELMARLPQLEIVSSFGVGYDNVDTAYAATNGITVTNTPDVLTEEVADTAIGLLLCAVRELPRAERYLRAGSWKYAKYPPSTATLRDRTIGIVGMGRIGRAIARRLDGFAIPVVYHSRRAIHDLPYRYYPSLLEMAREVDTLILIVPGGADTRHMIDAAVLNALGPRGIVINMARGSVIDDEALIAALRERRIHSAGLDVYLNEPDVPRAYLEMDHIVLFPRLGSNTVHTRGKMHQLVVDNLAAWVEGRPPLTPVPETPWVAWRARD